MASNLYDDEYIDWSEDQILEYIKCHDSVVYWAENYVWIEEKETGEIIPFNMLPYRRLILETLQAGHSIVVDKCRRAGVSWTVKTYMAWLNNFYPGSTGLDVSQKESDAIDLLDKERFVLEHLALHDSDDYELATKADWMSGGVEEWEVDNKRQLAIAWYDENGKLERLSKCDSLTTTGKSGRSRGAMFVLLDEWAFTKPDDVKIWSSIGPMTIRGTRYAKVSTPNGVSGDHYAAVMRARKAKRDGTLDRLSFKYIEVDWWDTEITQEQYDELTKDMTEDLIAQEFGREFLSSGSPAFSHVHLIDCFKPPSEYPEVATALAEYRQKVLDGENGFFYCSGVDSATGKPGKKKRKKDYDSWCSMTRHGIQAFAFNEKMTITKWAGHHVRMQDGNDQWVEGKTTELHREWPGTAYVEDNGPGEQVLSNHEAPNDGMSEIWRWTTTSKTKPKLVTDFEKAVENHDVTITDEFTFQCLLAFQDFGDGQYGAPDGEEFYDDPAITAMLAWQVLLRKGGFEIEWPDSSGPVRASITGSIVERRNLDSMLSGPFVEIDNRNLYTSNDLIPLPDFDLPDIPSVWGNRDNSLRSPLEEERFDELLRKKRVR